MEIKRINKKGEEGKTWIIGLLGFMLMVFAFTTFIYDGANKYNIPITEDNVAFISKINSTYSDLEGITNTLEKRTKEQETFSPISGLLTIGGTLLKAFKVLFNLVPIIGLIMESIADILLIPEFYKGIFYAMFLISIISFVIYMLLARKM